MIEEVAGSGFAGHDAGLLAFAGFHEVGVAGHDEATQRLGGLMAAVAVLSEDRPHVLVVTDLPSGVGDLRRFGTAAVEPSV